MVVHHCQTHWGYQSSCPSSSCRPSSSSVHVFCETPNLGECEMCVRMSDTSVLLAVRNVRPERWKDAVATPLRLPPGYSSCYCHPSPGVMNWASVEKVSHNTQKGSRPPTCEGLLGLSNGDNSSCSSAPPSTVAKRKTNASATGHYKEGIGKSNQEYALSQLAKSSCTCPLC
jgi:hypothetical protein